MIEDSPVNADRLLAIEATVDDMRSKNEATHQLLQTILDRLGPPQAQNAPIPTRRPESRRPSPLPTPSAGRKNISLKPSSPSEYNGDRSEGKAFLMSCRTYLHLCPEAFEDDATRIIWAMSYMKTGRAGRWAAREFEQEAREGHLRFLDWLDFEEEFRKDFLPLNSEAAAVNVLETTAYFQGKKSVDDYLDRFRDLVYDSGYTDPKTIVVKFRRGLDRQISTALAGMASGRPSDTDPEAWFKLAVRMDQNRAADEAFQASYRQPQAPSGALISRAPQPLHKSAPPARFAHSTPTPGNPVPMDIDATHRAKVAPENCHRCGKPGHWSKDCERRFDVRYMNADELEKAMEDKNAARDVAPAAPIQEAEVPDSVEDFVSHSG